MEAGGARGCGVGRPRGHRLAAARARPPPPPQGCLPAQDSHMAVARQSLRRQDSRRMTRPRRLSCARQSEHTYALPKCPALHIWRSGHIHRVLRGYYTPHCPTIDPSLDLAGGSLKDFGIHGSAPRLMIWIPRVPLVDAGRNTGRKTFIFDPFGTRGLEMKGSIET